MGTLTDAQKLRQYYLSLRSFGPIFDAAGGNVAYHPALVLAKEVKRLEADFPGEYPPFNPEEFLTGIEDGERYYSCIGIKAYVSTLVGRLQVAIEDPNTTPVTEQRDFSFVKDGSIKRILERDFAEAQRAYIAKCWKSVIVVSGGMIEAILVDVLSQNANAVSASRAPKQADIQRWGLDDLINVAVELKLVTQGAEKLSHSIREYRNLVHPGNEVRNNLHFDAEEARIALEVLSIVHRDLS